MSPSPISCSASHLSDLPPCASYTTHTYTQTHDLCSPTLSHSPPRHCAFLRYILLERGGGPRANGTDNLPTDDHQRACLHAAVLVPLPDDDKEGGEGGGSDENKKATKEGGQGRRQRHGIVDVFTTHLSLHEELRDVGVRQIERFMKDKASGPEVVIMADDEGEGGGEGVTTKTVSFERRMQVLCGDMNAEPQENAMRYLRGLAPEETKAAEGEGTEGATAVREDAEGGVLSRRSAGLKDVWLELFEEPTPRSEDAAEKQDALTFPSDNPSKRIDIMLGGGVEGRGVKVLNVTILGQDPHPSTALAEGEEPDGMVSLKSPNWASDHRALLTTFQL